MQNSVDAVLPGRINIIRGNPAHSVIVYSYSDVDPGSWYLLDAVKMTMRQFGKRRTSIQPESMRPKASIEYSAKDGLRIPAYLTLPAGNGKSLPAVVLIHGGPTQRDEWEWESEVQFLARSGYAVLQPQFRGASGFGLKFEQAGYGQWGLAMQDDITSGVQHLVSQGIADPQRICIVGASYGGFAAMWGLVSTPELFRCGVSFAGVSDLELMFTDSSDRNSSDAGDHAFPDWRCPSQSPAIRASVAA